MYQALACPLDPFTWIRQFEANAFQVLEQILDLGNIRLWKRRLSNGRQITLQMLKAACTQTTLHPRRQYGGRIGSRRQSRCRRHPDGGEIPMDWTRP